MIGNLVLTSDLTLPQLFNTKFGQLPLVFASDRGVPPRSEARRRVTRT